MALTKEQKARLDKYLLGVIERTPKTILRCPVNKHMATYKPVTLRWREQGELIGIEQVVSCQICNRFIQYNWTVKIDGGFVTVQK